ncbi:kelch repeat-containing protein [Ferruginibacter albus]|uniref:kelch repeat-containing protein n=1 Tax=Ferruginibacter albus TaxID=2875540 RepID=UPI001CC74E2E|nr:kelch repeat-containing protein [Ferruginibacter albus]UAY50853.1 hypothetical protein K9M53_09650 [Ferruginibacter albus]
MRKLSVCLYILFFYTGYSYAQENYGLTFNSFNVSQENRTGLEIGGDNAICFSDNMDLSFEFYFIPNRTTNFGYVFRMINNNGQNIDLLYNEKDKVFNTISGGVFTGVDFTLNDNLLFKQWTKVRYHFSHDSLACYINGTLCKTAKVSFKDKCFKLLFGANRSPEFSTTDEPPMVMRNISINESNQLKYLWTLRNGAQGNVIYDSVSNTPAIVTNPVWSEDLHKNWQPLKTLVVHGDGSVAYDPDGDNLYVVGTDSVYRLGISDVMSSASVSLSNSYKLFQGNQSIYNTAENKLYNFYIDIKSIAGYSPTDFNWDKKMDSVANTEYGHTDRIYVKEENALYIFGGYGQMKYKNQVQRYDFAAKTWQDIATSGDYFVPRYLAAAGKGGSHIYIIGGYGSKSGDQVLNPGHLYDLVDYNLQTHSFRKIYSLKEPDTSFVFAGSMVIDSVNNCFYALCFDKSKYDTKLKLMKGSLSKPEYEFLATTIPYAFHDVVSDADLFYSANTKQLIAVTQLVELGKQTTVKIYNIAFPPLPLISEAPANPSFVSKKLIAFITAAILIFVLLMIFLRRKKMVVTNDGTLTEEEKVSTEKNIIVEEKVMNVAEPSPNRVFIELGDKRMFEVPDFVTARESSVNIYLFGDFEIVDTEGNEISKQFSPLLKEMFLVILLNTLKGGKGITSEKLNDIFWENKTGKNAKNNLSVNIVRLKSILSKISDIHIVKNGERWECEFDSNKVSIDLADLLQLRSRYPSQHGKEFLSKMLYFVSRGAFLKQAEYAWLDDIKADVSNKIIDELLEENKNLNPDTDAEYIIEVANCIFNFDSLNEDALHFKCQTLDRLGRHSIAKTTYERFAKEYRKVYGEDFPVSFTDVLK